MYSDIIYQIVIDIVDNFDIDIDSDNILFDMPILINLVFDILENIYPEVSENTIIYKNIHNIFLKYLKDYKKNKIIFIENTNIDINVLGYGDNILNISKSEEFFTKLDTQSVLEQNTSCISDLSDLKITVEKKSEKKNLDKKNLDKKNLDKKNLDKKNLDKILVKNTVANDIYSTLVENSNDKLTSKVIELTHEKKEEIINHIEYLKKIPQAEQRSEEWYNFRKDHLTASDMSKILVKSVSQRRDLIISKCKTSIKNITGKACLHGIKYEAVAAMIYEKRNNAEILEFGCLPHKDIKHFAASPDGICSIKSGDLVGRMIEIKNPISREITGIPKYDYWVQMQGQLEVAELEYCDFLECSIKEYKNDEDFMDDGNEIYTSKGLEKGVIINILDIEKNSLKYLYCKLSINKKEINKWLDSELEKILKSPDIELVNITWWRLEKYSCTLVKRDKNWFTNKVADIYKFWEEVEHYREIGIEGLESQIKRKKKNNISVEKLDTCIMLSDEDSDIVEKLKKI